MKTIAASAAAGNRQASRFRRRVESGIPSTTLATVGPLGWGGGEGARSGASTGSAITWTGAINRYPRLARVSI